MLKKLLTFIMVLAVLIQPLAANANDLNAAFGNLLGPGAVVSVNSPGNYQSGARNSFIAGGLELRVPKGSSVPQLFSVTPPRLSAGCGGISAHFGGFSFISGAEFEQLLKSIASGAALGFVSMLTLKTLCPQCEAVVQFLKTAAQQAARLAKDSCKFGQELASKFMAGQSTTTNTQEVCGATLATNGTSSDFLGLMESIDGACTSMVKAVDSILGENPDAKTDKDKAAQLACQLGTGNITWQRLASFDVEGSSAGNNANASTGYTRKLILMNMLGVDLTLNGSEEVYCETEDGRATPTEAQNKKFCAPRLRPQDVVGLFMCGAPGSDGKVRGSTSARVQEYCATFFENKTTADATGGSYSHLSQQKVYTCGADKATCNQVSLGDSSSLVSGEGFLIQINKTLLDGVEAVRKDEVMPDSVIKLMQVAPYPLYQAINAAAVYPSAAADLIDAMSLLVAEQATVAFLDDALRVEGRASTGKKGCLSAAQATTILEAVASMRAANRSRLTLIAQNISTQEAISEQIRSVNLSIQKQVMSQDMLASGGYAQALGKALSHNVGNEATPAGN